MVATIIEPIFIQLGSKITHDLSTYSYKLESYQGSSCALVSNWCQFRPFLSSSTSSANMPRIPSPIILWQTRQKSGRLNMKSFFILASCPLIIFCSYAFRFTFTRTPGGLIDSRHNFTSQLNANLRSHTILLSPSHGQNFEELAELFLFREGRFSDLLLGTLANSLAMHRSHAPDWHLASGLFAALQR